MFGRTLAQYLAYLRSWSASQKYQRETGRDALTGLVDDFTAAWGDPALTRSVRRAGFFAGYKLRMRVPTVSRRSSVNGVSRTCGLG